MKLRTVKVYQAVRWAQKDETHFDTRIDRFKNVSLHYNVDMNAITISEPGHEDVIVFTTNVAYAVVSSEQPAAKKAK